MNFKRSEFDHRYQRLQQALDEQELDALVVTQEANFNYFTGFIIHQSWSNFSRNLIAVLPRTGQPALIVPDFLERSAREDGWIEQIYTYSHTGQAPIEALVTVCNDLGLAEGRIGAELDGELRLNLTLNDIRRIQSALPRARFEDASSIIWQLRIVKSEAEIDCLREACRIIDQSYAQIFQEARPGMTERQIAGRLGELMMHFGADRPGWIMMATGYGDYHRFFGVPRDRVVQAGEMLWFDIAAVYNGYWADYDRSGIFGGPSAEQAALQLAVHEATMAGVDAIRPGVPVAEVARITAEAMTELGFGSLNFGRLGHGIGLTVTEAPDVDLDDPTILQPGMTLTVEPVVIREDGIYQVEQNVVVTVDGHEILSQAPPEIQHLATQSI